ncbi:MAG: hypothetical protein H0S85_10470 [Desulfovibrionaceae bacterium]|jgi:hypothetical protein|nr:hypothetical protein [Desulfovibrionaceae bacterium]
MWIADVVGVAGSLTILGAYLLLQTERVDSRSPGYSVANFLGAAAILFSLAHDFNLAAALIEGFWACISLLGLWRALRRRRAGRG